MKTRTSFFVLSLAVAAGFASLAIAQSAAPGGPVGYYPTYQESGILAVQDYDYVRGVGGPLNGPDLDRWSSTNDGFWPYENQVGPMTDIQRAFGPLDYVTRFFTPGETLAIQDPLGESWLQVGGSFPFLTRTYHTERSTFADVFGMRATEYSPFFFDVMAVSAIAVMVDGDGPGFSQTGLEDGFVSALGFDIRAGWRLTDRTSLIINGQVYFVFTGDSEVQFYLDAGGLSAFANLEAQREIGDWDIRFTDNLIPFSSRRWLYDETYRGDIQQSGHYYVGIPNGVESGTFWDSRQLYLLNTAGITAGRFVGEDWRFMMGVGRVDTWLWNDFDQHVAREYISAGLFYTGYDWWIAPSLTYTLQSQNFAHAQSVINLNMTAPITPNITFQAGVGLAYGDYYDGWVWNASLQHQITAHLRQSINYSAGYQDVLVGDDFIGTRVDYSINYQLGSRITLGGYFGFFNGEENREDAVIAGASLTAALGNYTSLRLLAGYFEADYPPPLPGDGDTWVYSATITNRLAERLLLELGYEFIDNGPGRYTESVGMLRLTRTF